MIWNKVPAVKSVPDRRGWESAVWQRHSSCVLALSASAVLHAAAIVALGSLLLAPRRLPHATSPASVVVQVRLASITEPSTSGTAVTLLARMAATIPLQERAREEVDRPAAHRMGAAPVERVLEPPSAAKVQTIQGETTPVLATGEANIATANSVEPVAGAVFERGLGAPQSETAAASTPAAYLHTPEPDYPPSAREDEQQGLVVLRVLVSKEGRPVEIRIARTSGFRALDAAAIAGVKRWTFRPAKQGAQSIPSWMEVPIRFRLM